MLWPALYVRQVDGERWKVLPPEAHAGLVSGTIEASGIDVVVATVVNLINGHEVVSAAGGYVCSVRKPGYGEVI